MHMLKTSRHDSFGPGAGLAPAESTPAATGACTRLRGFTLLELLVVLVILGLLAGLVGPRLFGRADTARVQTAETQIQMLKSALLTYRLDMGRFPGEQEGLNALNTPPADENLRPVWQGPYLEDEVPVDPWRNPYQYRPDSSHPQGFVLYSFGADGRQGGEGLDAEIGYLPRQ